MPARICAFVMSLFFLFFGVAGFIGPWVRLPPGGLSFYANVQMFGSWGFIFGWLPSNLLHNLLYVVLGAAGLLSFPFFATATAYCRGMFAVAFLMAITGFIPGEISYLWGLLPLFGWNIMVHTVTAIAAYYYGYVYPLDLGGPEPASQMS